MVPRWWYAYIPLLYAGSGGKTLVGKFLATREQVAERFGDSAHINFDNGVVEFYKRPRPAPRRS
jgi:hypothetical protein